MGVVKNIILEEKKRLLSLKSLYIKSISKLTKGSVIYKIRGKVSYAYLSYRDGQKVITKYLGQKNSPRTAAAVNEVLKRKKLQESLKKVKLNLREITSGRRL